MFQSDDTQIRPFLDIFKDLKAAIWALTETLTKYLDNSVIGVDQVLTEFQFSLVNDLLEKQNKTAHQPINKQETRSSELTSSITLSTPLKLLQKFLKDKQNLHSSQYITCSTSTHLPVSVFLTTHLKLPNRRCSPYPTLYHVFGTTCRLNDSYSSRFDSSSVFNEPSKLKPFANLKCQSPTINRLRLHNLSPFPLKTEVSTPTRL